jgi:DNA-binding PucR family transcriptional regulator
MEGTAAGLSGRLRERLPEIEQDALTRIYAVSGPSESADPEYVDGLRAALAAALEYGLAAVEFADEQRPPIPPVLLAQARMAARSGVGLDTVLRRYLAGYTLLGDLLVDEGDALPAKALKLVLRRQAARFDRLLAAVSDEYNREAERRSGTPEQRRAERVRGLLDGELLDTSTLAYDFDACHTAAIASGPDAAEVLRAMAGSLEGRLLLVRHGEATAWAWFGSRSCEVESTRFTSFSGPENVSVALGEPARGLAGWRLTHRQAKAALSVAKRTSARLVRYADVALLASMLQDDLFLASLHHLYLMPLAKERDGGAVLRATLRAYFAAERNVTSAAAALGVQRHTVSNRLRVVEERLGCSLRSCATELDTALRLEALGEPLLPYTVFSRT